MLTIRPEVVFSAGSLQELLMQVADFYCVCYLVVVSQCFTCSATKTKNAGTFFSLLGPSLFFHSSLLHVHVSPCVDAMIVIFVFLSLINS